MLVSARTTAYTKKSILSAWGGAGLIPFNPRHVLDKLTYGLAPPRARAFAPPPEPPTPRNTAALHRRVRQATQRLKSKDADLNRAELAYLIQQLQNFGIAAEKDRELERKTLQQWQEAQKLEAKVDKRELGRSHGRVMDGKTLKELYLEREAAEAKKKKQQKKPLNQPNKRLQCSPTQTRQQSGKRKAVSFVTISSSDGEESISGDELDEWDSDLETLSISSDSSILSTITLATPAAGLSPGVERPHTPPSPTPGPSGTSRTPSGLRATRSRVSGR